MKKKSFFGFAAATLLAACLWSALPQPLRAQNLIDGTYLPPEPQTAGMLRYSGGTPNLYTGTVTAEIPVYVYSDPDFTIPISLSYSASGYRPGVPANYVGLGWTLNAGGCISRRVRGVKDENESGAVFGFKVASDHRDWSDTTNLEDIMTRDGLPVIHSGANNYETTSDIYMYSFMGHSGKFVIDRNGLAVVYDSSDPQGIVSVDLSQLRHQRFQSKITIETGDGYRYEFGGHLSQATGDDAIDCATTYTPASPSGAADRYSDEWYLTRITAPGGRTAVFTYRMGEGCMTKSVMPTANNKTSFSASVYGEAAPFQLYGFEYHSGTTPSYGYLVTEKSIVQLTSIVITDGGTVQFSYAPRLPERGRPNTILPVDLPQPDCLTGIVVQDTESNTLASCELSYKYTSQSGDANPVLLLAGVRDLSGAYSLSYYNESAAFPIQGSPAVDHWGYWNANPGTDIMSILPDATLDAMYRETISGTNRNPAPEKAVSGMLEKITYPTGGWTRFEYEPNLYRKMVVRNSLPTSRGLPVLQTSSTNATGGGLRVRAIEDCPSQGRSYRTEYLYENSAGTCSGILINSPRYYKAYRTTGTSTTGWTVILASNNQGCMIDGEDLEYSCVQEVHPDGSRTVRQFSTFADFPDSLEWIGARASALPGQYVHVDYPLYADNLFREPQSRAQLRGKLLNSTVWSADGQKTKTESYLYDTPGLSSRYVLDVAYAADSCYINKTYTGFAPLAWKTVTEYGDGQGTGRALCEAYTYNAKGQLAVHTVLNGSANRGSRYYYRYLTGRLSGCRTRTVKTAVAAEGQEYVIESDSLRYAAGGYNPSPIAITTYVISSPVRVLPGTDVFHVGTGGRFRKTDVTYTMSRKRVSRVNMPGGAYTEYAWNGGETHITRISRNVYENSWQYEWKGWVGIKKFTDPSGIRTSYEYDGANRLRTVRDGQGSKMAEYAYNLVSASDATTGADAWNYIRSYTYADAAGTSRAEDLRYYDGLGDPLLDVAFGGGGGGRNLVTRHETDSLRRVDARAWLPIGVSTSDDPVYMTPQHMDETTFRHWYMLRDNDTHPFVETVYGTSPEGKPRSVQQAGDVFRTAARKTLITRRVPNPAADSVFRIVPFVSNSTTAQQFSVSTGGWVTGDLLCECTVDEDGRKTETYTDCFGKTVLLRRWNGAQRLDTYYVYDLCDRPVLVLQPQGSKDLAAYAATGFDAASDIVRLYGFQYVYDGDGTLVRRRIPGGCWEDFVYDARQRKRYFTDAALLENGLYIRYDYDTQDRIVRETLLRSPIGITPESVRSSYVSGGAGSVDAHFSQVRTLRECKYWGDTGYTSLSAGGIPAADQAGMAFLRGLLACETLQESPATDGTLTTNAASLTRRYGYDHRGRIIYVRETDGPGWMLTRRMTYDFNGHLLTQSERLQSPEGGFAPENTEAWTYDTRGRVLSYSHSYGGSQMTAVTYTYDDLGRLCAKSYDGGKAAQTFSRNLQGWSTGSSMTWGGTALFTEALSYYDPVLSTTEPLYAGHISEALSAHQGRQQVRYSYAYDGAGRLSGARLFLPSVGAENPAAGMTGIAYDRNGNLLGYTGKEIRAMTIDLDYGFTYSGNRLSEKTLHRRTGPIVYPDRTSTFSYDLRGNLTGHGEKDLEIRYNLLNLPMSVQQADSSDMARFIYLSDGTKVGAVRGDSQRISYRGSYLLSGPSSLSQAVESVRWAEGVCATRTDGLGMGDYLYVTDHLGNVRSTVALYSEATAAPGTVVLDRSDYLPFGERVADLTAFSLTRPFTAEGDLHRWHLGGKEEVPEGGMNLLDFGARYYDPALCRWTSLDPLSEKYYGISPYAYCNGDPVNLVDPDGAKIHISKKSSDSFKKNVFRTIKYMERKGTATGLRKLQDSKFDYYITESPDIYSRFIPNTRTIEWNDKHIVEFENGIWSSPSMSLFHEAEHAVRQDKGLKDPSVREQVKKDRESPDEQYGNKEEMLIITGPEQDAARKQGEIRKDQVTRTNHSPFLFVYPVDVDNSTPEEIEKVVREHNELL